MSNPERFEMLVEQCRADIAEHLPGIAERHSPLALLAALSEHVGGALHLFIQSGKCTREEARAVLDRCEHTAFD